MRCCTQKPSCIKPFSSIVTFYPRKCRYSSSFTYRQNIGSRTIYEETYISYLGLSVVMVLLMSIVSRQVDLCHISTLENLFRTSLIFKTDRLTSSRTKPLRLSTKPVVLPNYQPKCRARGAPIFLTLLRPMRHLCLVVSGPKIRRSVIEFFIQKAVRKRFSTQPSKKKCKEELRN